MHRLQDPGRDTRTPDGVIGSSLAARGSNAGGATLTGSSFRAAWWCRGPHLQTLWPTLFRRRPRPRYRRERFELPDGDFLDLDWFGPPEADSLVMVLHGLEGSSASHYVRGLCWTLAALDIPSVVVHQRGCGGEPNRLARFYHAGETEDLSRVADRLATSLTNRRLYAVGYSLGGNILLKWLGQSRDSPLVGAAAISVPFRLADGARRLERGLSRLYQTYLLRSMKHSVARKRARMRHPIDPERLAKCRTFEQIDTCLTAPLHGFRDAQDYYVRSSSRQFLGKIRTPTLIIHARDDPFMTASTIPSAAELPPAIRLELSRHGGHCGFIAGGLPWRPHYWLEQRIPAFICGKR